VQATNAEVLRETGNAIKVPRKTYKPKAANISLKAYPLYAKSFTGDMTTAAVNQQPLNKKF
jgi:hypothetical protein